MGPGPPKKIEHFYRIFRCPFTQKMPFLLLLQENTFNTEQLV